MELDAISNLSSRGISHSFSILRSYSITLINCQLTGIAALFILITVRVSW